MMFKKKQDIRDLTLSDIMRTWPQTVPVFLRHGMHCVGCRIGPFHTIADACAEYHLDEAVFVAELQGAISAAPRVRPA
jgi:hybrid cluster-associated redox disulfide protein